MTFSNRKNLSTGDVINLIALLFAAVVCVLPFVYIVNISLTSPDVYVPFKFYVFPEKLSFYSYRYILSTSTFLNAAKNTAFITAVGTVLCLFTTFTTAYALTKKSMPGHNFFIGLVTFTLIFNAGIIPNYLMVRGLGLINTPWALILSSLTSAWYLIVVKSFMAALPVELEEAAKIDGCNDLMVFGRIILPLSLSSIAAFTLFFAVMHWNTYFNAMLYLTNSHKWTLQVLIKSIVVDNNTTSGGLSQVGSDQAMLPQEPIRYASVVVAILPILVVYPFLQRYFVKGMMLGAIKG